MNIKFVNECGFERLYNGLMNLKQMQFGEGLDVILRKSVGMISRRYRILLRRETEGIVSHRMKNVISLHSLHS